MRPPRLISAVILILGFGIGLPILGNLALPQRSLGSDLAIAHGKGQAVILCSSGEHARMQDLGNSILILGARSYETSYSISLILKIPVISKSGARVLCTEGLSFANKNL